MKAITSQFGKLHGISSLLNLTTILVLAFHGLSVADKIGLDL